MRQLEAVRMWLWRTQPEPGEKVWADVIGEASQAGPDGLGGSE